MWRLSLDHEEIKRLYLDGFSERFIAERLGVSKGCIHKRLKSLSVPLRTGGETHHIMCQKGFIHHPLERLKLNSSIIRERYLTNVPIPKIAQELGCSNKAVETRLINMRIYEIGRWKRLRRERPEINSMWRGGRMVAGGYVYIKLSTHPRANKHGYVPEHILVWEQNHSRALPDGWLIHHLNGIKDDNRSENLAAMPKSKHSYLIPALRQRVRSLDDEVKRLTKVLTEHQLIFYIGGETNG